MAQGAAAAAVAVRTKNKDFRQVAGSSAFSGLFAGITEPALYGVTLRLKKPMLGACIGAVAGGLFGGFFQLKCFGIATPAIISIVQYIENDRSASLLIAALTIAVTAVVAFIATMLIGFEDVVDEDDDIDLENTQAKETTDSTLPSNAENVKNTISAPIKGKTVLLSSVDDPTFSTEVLGKGTAIIPEIGEVYAPFDGTVSNMFDTGHAMGLESNDGIELLIHVGLETVNLKGKYYTPLVKSGDKIKKGDLLLKFDIDKIIGEGYSTVTPVIITNADSFNDIASEEKNCDVMDTIITIK